MAESAFNIVTNFRLFCEDLISSLLSNIYSIKQDGYKLFLYRLTVDPKLKRSHITPEVEKAVHTLAYLFRYECLSVFNRRYFTMGRKLNFDNYVKQLTIPNDNYYVHLLAWMAFLYELTVRSFLNNFDHTETTLECMVRFTDLTYFEYDEHWNKFIETANSVARFYDLVVESLGGSFPESDILAPFQFTLKETLRLRRYKLHLTEIMLGDPELANCERFSKLKCNPELIRFGHTVLRKNKTLSSSKKNSTVSERTLCASNTQPDPYIQMADVQFSGGLSTSSAASNVLLPDRVTSHDKENLDVDAYKNSVFVITNRYRFKRAYDQNYYDRKYFKIYSPSKEKFKKVENLNSILEQNIKAGNMEQISEKLFVVPRGGARDMHDSKKIIVVDSSSDEEEDEFDPFQRSFVTGVQQRWKKLSLGDIEMMHFVLKSRFWEPRLPDIPPVYSIPSAYYYT